MGIKYIDNENLQLTEKEAIETMVELYIKMSTEQEINHIGNDRKSIDEYQIQARRVLEGVLEKIEDDTKRIEFLKGIIEEIIETNEVNEMVKFYIKRSTERENNRMNNNPKLIEDYQIQTRRAVESVIGKMKSNKERIAFLKGIIEEITENNPEKEQEENPEKEKSNEEIEMEFYKGYYKQYYKKLLEKINQIGELEKINQVEENERYTQDEKIILGLIKESKEARFHEDKSEKEEYSYGDFSLSEKSLQEEQKHKKEEILYHDENMTLIRKESFESSKWQTAKQAGENSKVCIRFQEKEGLSKYEFQIQYQENKVASIEFFGETALGNQIEKGALEYFAPMLAAIANAKENGREHIGRITEIDKELKTFVTQYDDNLEASVKRLVEKEKQEKRTAEDSKDESIR